MTLFVNLYMCLILSFYSLNQFVKGCGNFAMEMADAILNSLTNGRHMKFVESLKKEDEKPSQEKVLLYQYCTTVGLSVHNCL